MFGYIIYIFKFELKPYKNNFFNIILIFFSCCEEIFAFRISTRKLRGYNGEYWR